MRTGCEKKEKATKGVKTEPLIFILEGQAVLQYSDKDFNVHEIVKVRAGDVLGLTELLNIEVSSKPHNFACRESSILAQFWRSHL